ncbi:MAG: short-chain dehydrogenase [Gemmataceae bacterium]
MAAIEEAKSAIEAPTEASGVVLITGAAGGLGRALGREAHQRGYRLALLDRDGPRLSETAAALGGARVAMQVADVTDRPAVQQAVRALVAELGPVDLLVACAGIGLAMPCLQFRTEDLEKQVAVNLVGVANTVEAVLPDMLARRRGHLVAISSLASYRGLPWMAGYCASKAGLNALMESLRFELKPHGIRCTTVCPGWIRTPLAEYAPFPKPDMLEAEDAARRIWRAIERRKEFVAFPLRPRLLQALGRRLPAGLSDWLLEQYVRYYTGTTRMD